jgi:hypothetical protein
MHNTKMRKIARARQRAAIRQHLGASVCHLRGSGSQVGASDIHLGAQHHHLGDGTMRRGAGRYRPGDRKLRQVVENGTR